MRGTARQGERERERERESAAEVDARGSNVRVHIRAEQTAYADTGSPVPVVALVA